MTELAALDAQAQTLRAEGLTYREIGERMGEDTKKAWRRCNRERDRDHGRAYKARHAERIRAVDKARRQVNRATCPKCGYLYGEGTTRNDGTPIGIDFSNCRGCKEKRRQQIQSLWCEGLTLREIAERLGTTKGCVGVEINRMRADGVDVPYRNRHLTTEPVFPEQVAA